LVLPSHAGFYKAGDWLVQNDWHTLPTSSVLQDLRYRTYCKW